TLPRAGLGHGDPPIDSVADDADARPQRGRAADRLASDPVGAPGARAHGRDRGGDCGGGPVRPGYADTGPALWRDPQRTTSPRSGLPGPGPGALAAACSC